jgi:hypothetical protein
MDSSASPILVTGVPGRVGRVGSAVRSVGVTKNWASAVYPSNSLNTS